MRYSISAAAWMLFCSVAFGAPTAPEVAPEAVVAKLSGQVEVMALDADEWRPAAAGQELRAGDSIRVGKKGRALVHLGDDIELNLGAGTTIVIQDSENTGQVKPSVALLLGSLFAKVTAPDGGQSPFEVAGSNAVAGVRGTEFTTAVALDGTFRAAVEKGKVIVEGESASVSLLPGQFSQVEDDKQPSKPAGAAGVAIDDWLEKRRQAVLARAPELVEIWMDKIVKIKARVEKLSLRTAAIEKQLYELATKARMARHSRQRQALVRIRARMVKLITEAVGIRRRGRRLGARLNSRLTLLRGLVAAAEQGALDSRQLAKLAAVALKARQLAPAVRNIARGRIRGIVRQMRMERQIMLGMKMRYRDFLRKQGRRKPLPGKLVR